MAIAATLDYVKESQKVRKAIREIFGENAAIATHEGYEGRVHVKLVSPLFDGLSASEKQDKFWESLRERLGEEAQTVSLAEIYGMDQV